MTDRYTLHHGNNLDILPTIPDATIDAIITDPPYELGFMGKKWDASGIAYSIELWAECLRVLKPGGHLLAFGGTRTYHRMTCAIEDAGFEIRDSLHWIYGSGFPKSLDVSKAIDKRGGNVAGFEQFRDAVKEAMKRNGVSRAALSEALGNHMLSHYLTAGSQPAVPNIRDYRIIRETVRLGNDWDHLFLDEAEREVIGKSDSTILEVAPGEGRNRPPVTLDITAPATDAAKQWEGWGTALKPAHEPIVLARKPLTGTVAANVLQHGTGALNINACRIPMGDEYDPTKIQRQQHSSGAIDGAFGAASLIGKEIATYKPGGRWPANVMFDIDAANELGPEARYFYVAKASRVERNAGLDQRNTHPTVKPITLMRYLIRLVTPPDGTILDPFAGSGTTLAAAIIEGFYPIGIELTDDYHPIIHARCQHATTQHHTNPPTLFDS